MSRESSLAFKKECFFDSNVKSIYDYTFFSKFNVNQHVASVHEGKQPFKFSACLLKKVSWRYILHLFVMQWSPFYEKCVTHKPLFICYQFMKERSLSNVTFVLLVFFKPMQTYLFFLFKAFIHFTNINNLLM